MVQFASLNLSLNPLQTGSLFENTQHSQTTRIMRLKKVPRIWRKSFRSLQLAFQSRALFLLAEWVWNCLITSGIFCFGSFLSLIIPAHPKSFKLHFYDKRLQSGFVVGRGGFELPTFRLSVERSSRAELPAHRIEHRSLILCMFIRFWCGGPSRIWTGDLSIISRTLQPCWATGPLLGHQG